MTYKPSYKMKLFTLKLYNKMKLITINLYKIFTILI